VPELRSVLHVLPHPGGGGETYVDALSQLEGYRFERAYLAAGPDPAGARAAILRRAVEVQRAAFSFDLLHVIGEVASTLCLPALASRPSVMSPQGLNLLRRLDGARKQVGKANLRLIVRAATRTICASNTEYADLVSSVGSRAAARALVIHNGVPVREPVSPERRAASRAELGIATAATVGAWISALDQNKDPLSAIRAVNAVRRDGAPLTLLVAGDGPLRAEVEEAARETDAVRVLGFRQDVERILAASDFFVFSSRREGFSFALLEAMSLGIAPVVSDAPANVEAVGEAGIVVPRGDPAALADGLRRVLGEPERVVLAERARSRIAQYFGADEMLSRTRELYDEVVLERSTSRRRRDGGAGSPRS
jgi:glycosyltransferase involved in cell wall biosynthesis